MRQDWVLYEMHSHLFFGCLALGCVFLILSVIIPLLLGRFIDQQYISRIKQLRNVDNRLTVYGPLRRISRLYVIVSGADCIAAFTQVLGIIADSGFWSFCCLSLAGMFLLLTFIVFLQTVHAIGHWYDDAEERTRP